MTMKDAVIKFLKPLKEGQKFTGRQMERRCNQMMRQDDLKRHNHYVETFSKRARELRASGLVDYEYNYEDKYFYILKNNLKKAEELKKCRISKIQ